jgi:proline-specific peptidase
MGPQMPTQQGSIPFRGYHTWYRIAGDRVAPGKVPLLCLHGGPGLPHDYLEPLEAVAETGRRVIFCDQLGCGNSDHPHDPSLWTVSLSVDELERIRDGLELDRVHLFGHSWGGMLAMEYALAQPPGVASLILADTPASIPQWIAEIDRLRAELPPDVQATLQKHEAAGTMGDPAYQEAIAVFHRRHACRLDPWPEPLNRSFAKVMQNPEVQMTMTGPDPFIVTGTLEDWDITERLGEIRLPALVVGGRYDVVTPALTGALHRAIAGSEWVILENSAHMPHFEEPERYLQVLTGFLDRVEAREQDGRQGARVAPLPAAPRLNPGCAYSSRMARRTFSTTSGGTVSSLWTLLAWAATFSSSSASVSALTIPSQSNPTSRQWTTLATFYLLFYE